MCPVLSATYHAQVVGAREHLLIMGIRNWPYQLLEVSRPDSERVSFSSLRSMAGNGMHAAAIGAILYFALGAYEWV